MLEPDELDKLSTEELILMAFRHHLIDDCWVEHSTMRVRIADREIPFDEKDGTLFLRGLLRGYLHAVSQKKDRDDDTPS